MRKLYTPPSAKQWAAHFSTQKGHGFKGIPYQRGVGLGSIIGSLFRAAVPTIKSVGKAVGREALSSGVRIASDVLSGQDIGKSAERRGREAGGRLLNKVEHKVKRSRKKRKQVGGGLGKWTGGVGGRRISIKGKKKSRKVKDVLGF